MLLSMSCVFCRNVKCLFDLELPEVACLEEAAPVDTAVLVDFSVVDYAMCIAQGSQLLD